MKTIKPAPEDVPADSAPEAAPKPAARPATDVSESNAPELRVGAQLEAQTLFKSPAFPDSYLFPYNPDPLCSGNNYDIYDEMRMDDQVKAAVSVKKDMVVGTGWQIECEDEAVKEQVEKSLHEMHEFDALQSSIDDVMRELLSAYEFGFSIAEPVFLLGKDGLYAHKSVRVRPPHTFKFDLSDKGDILKVIQVGHGGDKPYDPKKFIHHVYQPEFGNPYGRSDLQAAHVAWKAKKHFVKMYCVYGERFACPTVVGKYDPSADANEITKLFNSLKKIQFNTTLVMPSDAMVDFVHADASSAQDFYVKAIELFNLWIARAILVPDLMGLSGAQTGSSGGSFALGNKQFEVLLSTIRKDRESLENKITSKLIRPLVAANFGDIPCKFKFKPYSDDKLIEYLKMWADVVKAKVYEPNPQEIEHFRECIKFPKGPVNIPVPQEIDPLTGLPMPPKPGAKPGEPGAKPGDKIPPKTAPGSTTKNDAEGEPLKAKPDGARPGMVPAVDGSEDKPKKFARSAPSYEAKMDFEAVRAELDDAESMLYPVLRDATRKIYLDLVDQIRTKGIIEKFSPERIKEVQPRFQREMNNAVMAVFTNLFKTSLNEARTELFPSGKKKFVADDVLPGEFLDVLRAETFELVGNYSQDVTKKAKSLLVRGIKDGVSEGKLVGLIRDEMKANTEIWLSTVSRTKTTEIYNSARKTYWDSDPIAKEIIVAFQFSAVMDDRTSAICSFLDGKVFDKGELTDMITPPLHFNCRSVLVPVTKYEEYKADKEPTFESLRDKGANLLAVPRSEEHYSLETEPRLTAVLEIREAVP